MKSKKFEELLKLLTTIDFEDIASVPQEDQPNFVEHVESLQEQLMKILNNELSKQKSTGEISSLVR